MTQAVEQGDFETATAVAQDLVFHGLRYGRLREALQYSDREIDYARRSGLGPWTQLVGELRRFLIKAKMGYAQDVLPELNSIRIKMETLPRESDRPETVSFSSVWNIFLDLGREVTERLNLWQESLDFNNELVDHLRNEGSSNAVLARHQFASYGPLIALGRLNEAMRLLLHCRGIFEKTNDILMLGGYQRNSRG